MRHLIPAGILALILTACTPSQVHTAFQKAGHDITWDEAEAVSEWTEAQDCLPQAAAIQHIECAVADSWRDYGGLGVTLDAWAAIAICESGLNPRAVNRSSGAAGLFQHLPSYWSGRAAESGYPNDPFNPRANAYVSAWLASRSSLSHWEQCR